MAASVLTSPGQATADRASFEDELTRVIGTKVTWFTQRVALLATGPDPFTLGAALAPWQDVVEAACEVMTGRGLPTDYVAAMRQRLAASPLPAKVYASARTVLTLAQANDWTGARLAKEMHDALDPETPFVEAVHVLTAALEPGPAKGQSAASIAAMVARTEATAAFNFGQIKALSDAKATTKKWVAHHDKVTRPTHLAVDGTEVDLNATFLVGGYALMFPGDHNGPLSETANCRCVLVGGSVAGAVNQYIDPRRPTSELANGANDALGGILSLRAQGLDMTDRYLANPAWRAQVEQWTTANKAQVLGSDQKLFVAMPADRVDKLLASKRFKNAFEAKTTAGAGNRSYLAARRYFEDEVMGVQATTKAARPIYGYIAPTPGGFGEQYGYVNVRLKREVLNRTSVTWGDSLDSGLTPLMYDDVASASVQQMLSARSSGGLAWTINAEGVPEFAPWQLKDGLTSTYREAQIHGGLSLDDVEEFVVDRGALVAKVEFGKFEAEIEDARKALVALDSTIETLKAQGYAVKVIETLSDEAWLE